MSFNLGENIGPYRIIEQLGQGGMATVYKAYHAALDRYVALKVLHLAFNEDKTFITRFQREARVVAKLEHPNIVPIYDYSEHEARPYLVMKYIEGDTLKARLNQGPLTSKEIDDVVNSIGSALAYAHRQGILHRDIKPSNVMIANDGTMYLADFGLARIAQAGESTMSSDSIMGTPQYISPEQAMGKKDLDAGTDIYSFGVMFYEMVVGQVPFSGDTPFSIIHNHIYMPLPLPRKVNPNVPEPVQRVLLKALAKDRLDRYETVEDMMKAFKSAWREADVPMKGTSVTIRPSTLIGGPTVAKTQTANPVNKTGTAEPKKKAKHSSWIWLLGASLISLVLIGFAFVAILNNNTKTPISPTAAVSVISATNIPQVILQPTLPVSANISPQATAAPGLVNQNSKDANMHLQLALALWDAKQTVPALSELAQSSKLADPNDKIFFLNAAQEFKKRQAWTLAVTMYLRLVESNQGQSVPADVENDFHEAVYKAAEEKAIPLNPFFARIDSVEPSIGFVARGRYALFNGDIADAQTQLANAEKLKPDMYEVSLLKAEIDLSTGNQADAKNIFLALSSDANAPEWIRVMAENYLKTIK